MQGQNGMHGGMTDEKREKCQNGRKCKRQEEGRERERRKMNEKTREESG